MKKLTRATEPYGCASSGAASGQDSGGRRHPVTESGGVSTAAGPVYRLVRVAFRWLSVGAPGRIRTCAHGSGGRSCSRLPPGKTRAGVPVGERMGGAQLAAGSARRFPRCFRVIASMAPAVGRQAVVGGAGDRIGVQGAGEVRGLGHGTGLGIELHVGFDLVAGHDADGLPVGGAEAEQVAAPMMATRLFHECPLIVMVTAGRFRSPSASTTSRGISMPD